MNQVNAMLSEAREELANDTGVRSDDVFTLFVADCRTVSCTVRWMWVRRPSVVSSVAPQVTQRATVT
jgi:hypothetical protein